MGGGSSRGSKKESEERKKQKRMLMHRKVTKDLLEKLSRSLPKAPNSLGKTLRLDNGLVGELEWEANLLYLDKWKVWKKDEATIGNLIALLKKAGFREEIWECLFNVSREPKNATTTMDPTEDFLSSRPTTQHDFEFMKRQYPLPAYRVSPAAFQNECFSNSQTPPNQQLQLSPHQVSSTDCHHPPPGSVPRELMHQRTDQYPQESMMNDVLRFHDNRAHNDDHNSATTKTSSSRKTPNIHSLVNDA